MESIPRLPDANHSVLAHSNIRAGTGSDLLVDAVDASDVVIDTLRRGDVLGARANFRVVHVLVFNRARELLLQHIAGGLRHAGSWGSSAAGFVLAGESYDAAAGRKLTDELRVPPTVQHVGRTSMLEGASIKFIGVYEASHEGPFHFDPASASAVEFLSIPAIRAHHVAGSRCFTPTFLTVLDFYESRTVAP